MEFGTFLLVQIVPILLLILYFLHRKNQYWSKRGLKGPAPWPLFGNFLQIVWQGQVRLDKEWFAKYGKLYGYYTFMEPTLTIADHELIKQVLVKDFHVFVNREKNIIDHEFWKTNLLSAEDDQWKRIRAITSPSFTTGKLRGMNAMMNRCVDKLGEYFEKVIQQNDGKMNAKVFTRFTIDVIASTSFATDTNVYGEKKNAFVENGLGLFNFAAWRFMAIFLLPTRVNRWLSNSVGFNEKNFYFFHDLAKEIIRQRRQQGTDGGGQIKRNDLVQLLIDAFVNEGDLKSDSYDRFTASVENDDFEEVKETSNGTTKRTLTETEIIAQCIFFFIAGFETTSTSLSNALYQLALHPELQDRLHDELTQALDGVPENSDQYYDIVNNKLPYLNAVMKETLRINPPLTRLQRRVGIDEYKLAGITLVKDQEVQISTLAVHYNPEYYPEPERFNPDRFMPENKHLLIPYTYLPFGEGPRNCVGMRFAYQEIKLCLAKIIRQYKFEPTPETKIPLDYEKIGFMTSKNIQLRVSITNENLPILNLAECPARHPQLVFGNFWAYIRNGPQKMELQWAQTYGKVYGMFVGTAPVLTITDHELIRQVLIKDFPVFVNRTAEVPFYHEIMSKNLFSTHDEAWKRIRTITSPSFTTGKLRGMHRLLNRCVGKLCDRFDQIITTTDGCINIKEVITGFTIDSIASTSFATETNATSGDMNNPFLIHAFRIARGSVLRLLAFMTLPKVVNKWLGNSLGSSDSSFDFFVNLSRAVVKARQGGGSKGVKRNDLVQLMIDSFVYEDELSEQNYDKLTATSDEDATNHKSKNGHVSQADSTKKSLTENEIIAQCILFFTAGFETTAVTLSKCLEHLTKNLEEQNRLHEELVHALDGIEEDSPQYLDMVMNGIPYLDAVIKETLRLDGPVLRLQRAVGVDGYKLGGLRLEKNQQLEISSYAVHHNPEYYPEPERFNPDRFMPENKHLLVPYTYLPFGDGPRNCVGMRFALQEIKLCVAKIIRHYRFEQQPPKSKSFWDFKFFESLVPVDVPIMISKR